MELVWTMCDDGMPMAQLVDGESIKELPIKTCKDGLTLEVEENPTNRRWIKLATLQEKGKIVLEGREKRVLGTYNKNVNKKPWVEYMTPEELETYNGIKEKCEARKKAAEMEAPKSEADKLKDRLAKLQAQYEALLAKEGK